MKRKVAITIIIGLIPLLLMGQQSRTLFFMHNVPQAIFVNPAVQPLCKYFVGVPLLTSLHANASSSGFRYNDLVNINAQALVDGLHGVDFVTGEVQLNLLSFGFKRNDFYYFFNIAERADARLFYPEKLLRLVAYGNDELAGKALTTRGLGAKATHWREISFNLSQTVSTEYTWGVRAKLLFGLANLNTAPVPIIFSTSKPDYHLLADWGFIVNSSVPLEIEKQPNGDVQNVELGAIDAASYLFNLNNLGFAADFGAIYVAEPYTWSVSVLDIGALRWVSNARSFTNYGTLTFEGLTPDDVLNAEGFLQTMQDSLSNQLRVRESAGSYFSGLTPIVNVGATRSIGSQWNMGLLLRTEFSPRRPQPSVTLSINSENTQRFFWSASYSVMNGSFANIGLGLGVRLQSVGLHIITDNVPGLICPQDSHTANIRFGASILLGCPRPGGKIPYKGPGCKGIAQ